MSGFGAFSVKLDELGKALGPQGSKALVRKCAMNAKTVFLHEIRVDLGADRRMSNWWRQNDGVTKNRKPRRPVTFSASFKLLSDTEAVVKPTPLGPFKVVDEGRTGNKPIRKGRKGYPGNSPRSTGHGTGRRIHAKIESQTGKIAAKHFGDQLSQIMLGKHG